MEFGMTHTFLHILERVVADPQFRRYLRMAPGAAIASLGLMLKDHEWFVLGQVITLVAYQPASDGDTPEFDALTLPSPPRPVSEAVLKMVVAAATTQGGSHKRMAAGARGQEAQESVEALSEADSPTQRELQVLQLMAQRYSNEEIAALLQIAPGTLKNHVSNLYGKLKVHNRDRAVRRGRELGLID
jgi:DNA-binding CsgD family transcriptional regulator